MKKVLIFLCATSIVALLVCFVASKTMRPEVKSIESSVVLAQDFSSRVSDDPEDEYYQELYAKMMGGDDRSSGSGGGWFPCGKGWKLYINYDANGMTPQDGVGVMWCDRATENDRCSCLAIILYNLAQDHFNY